MSLAACALNAQESAEPADLLERIRERMKSNLDQLPDYTCAQRIQRMRRANAHQPWQKYDALRVDVAYVGGEELHGWTGSKLGEKELRELAGTGAVGTGSFGMHARNVFLGKATRFSYVGESPLMDGRQAIRYDFEVPREGSVYKVRARPLEAIVAFRGAFWVHPDTLDLLKLMIEVDEAPGLPIASVSDVMEYRRAPIGSADFLLPKASELLIVSHDGAEHRNLTQVEGCRQYRTESSLKFDDAESIAPAPAAESFTIPAQTVLEASLDSNIDFATAAAGDAVRAVLTRAVKQGDRVLAPEGAVLTGKLTRVEQEAQPFVHYVIGLELTSMEWPGGRAELRATMEDAAGAGVMKVQKEFMPSFDRNRRTAAMSILVREQQKGQGIIHWDARRGRLAGLRMKWQVH